MGNHSTVVVMHSEDISNQVWEQSNQTADISINIEFNHDALEKWKCIWKH